MEVLEKGSGWSIKERCTGKGNGDGGCNSLLKIQEADLFKTETYCWRSSELNEECITFQCPVCNKYTDLDKNKIPYQIRKKLVKKVFKGENTKILKEGKRTEECKFCNSLLEIEVQDLFFEGKWKEYKDDNKVAFNCPVCQNTNILSRKKITRNVYDMIANKYNRY